MIFEGSEKKFELTVRDDVNLLDWPESHYAGLVRAANTQILSKIENRHTKAYLLSESSLFVWRNRLTMITCGTTTLVDAALRAFDFLKPEQVEAFFYQRKNEYFPQLQSTDFINDTKKLNARIKGKGFRLGRPDEHHLFLFHSDQFYNAQHDDKTLEVLMYGLQGKARSVFNTTGLDTKTIRLETGVDQIVPGFQVDDFAFSPIGYSLNAIQDDRFYTIHVTPQDESPYVSFETNLTEQNSSPELIQKTLQSVLAVFQPQSFDIIYFDPQTPDRRSSAALSPAVSDYDLRSEILESLSCGYDIQYSHHSQGNVKRTRAHKFKI